MEGKKSQKLVAIGQISVIDGKKRRKKKKQSTEKKKPVSGSPVSKLVTWACFHKIVFLLVILVFDRFSI